MVDANNSDSQAVWMLQGVGPCRISNNYLEAASENILLGGGATAIAPADLHIHGNHFFKPESWLGVYAVKNLFEIKNARRVLVENNVMENCWTSAQTGYAWVLLTSSQSNGDAPQYQSLDITMRWNKVRGHERAYSLTAAYSDANPTTAPMSRITIRQNLFYDPRTTSTDKGRAFIFKSSGSTPIAGLTIENNTIIYTGNYQGVLLENQAGAYYTGPKADSFSFNDNITCSGTQSNNTGFFTASGVTPGFRLMTDGWTTVSCERNGLIAPSLSAGGYPVSNLATGSAALSSAQFSDLAGHNYTLGAGSPLKGIGSAGADPGVAFTTLESAIAGVV